MLSSERFSSAYNPYLNTVWLESKIIIPSDKYEQKMYGISSLKSAIIRPRAIFEEINRFYKHGFGIRSSPAHNEQGIDVMSEDWDNLIILDACRFDTFEELAGDLPGELRKVESKASSTHLFLRANFEGRDLSDTVYVTANPQLYKNKNGLQDVETMDVSFHDRIDVWQDDWHDEHRTVMPEDVTEAALEASEQYPNKRLIIHFVQPHAPYVGKIGKELPTYRSFWGTFRDGEFDISLETAKQAYRENLELALPHVSELLSEFEGRTVVTADHGELLGERDFPIPIRRYGHPSYTKMSGVIEVPWFVHEDGARPEIVSETHEDVEDAIDSEVVEERLRDLGYTD